MSQSNTNGPLCVNTAPNDAGLNEYGAPGNNCRLAIETLDGAV